MELVKELKNIYKSFSNDVGELMKREPIWGLCSMCPDAFCCKRESVPVMSPEWDRIINYIRNTFTQDQKRRYKSNVESKKIQCPFLTRNQCEVYQIRPWVCRTYPYTISFHQSFITHQSGQFIAPNCPNLSPEFGNTVGTLQFFDPKILEKVTVNNLVKIEISTGKQFWVIDITKYQGQYENLMPRNEYGTLEGDDMHNWVGLATLSFKRGIIDRKKYLEILGLD